MEEQYSHLQTLLNTLNDSKEYLLCLEQRQEFLSSKMNSITGLPYDKNEAKILFIETTGKIKALKKSISEKEQYFKEYSSRFDKEYAEMIKDYDKTISLSKTRASHNEVLSKFLTCVNWEHVKINKEFQLDVYKRLKKMNA